MGSSAFHRMPSANDPNLLLLVYGRLPRLGVDGFISGHIRQLDEPGPGLVEAIGSLADGLVSAGGLFHGVVSGSVGTDDVEEQFMEQRLDHFDRQESRTFSQRYFINKK